MVSNAAALLLASEVNFLASYWKLKIIPISHTAANNKLLILSWLEDLCGLPKQDNYLATLSRPHQVAFCGIRLLLGHQSLIIWHPGEDLENSSLSPLSTQDCVTWCRAIAPTVLQSMNMVHPSGFRQFSRCWCSLRCCYPSLLWWRSVQPLYLSTAQMPAFDLVV